jgi:hypothetical protein
MVPDLYAKEMSRRKTWYSKHPEAVKKVSSGEEVGERSGERTIYSADDYIPISLEYVPREINYTYCSAGVQCGNPTENDKNKSHDNASASKKDGETDKNVVINGTKSNGLPTALTTTSGEHGKKRYLRCVAGVPIRVLKKLIRQKFDLKYNHDVEMFYKHDILLDDYTILDLAYIYSWRCNNPLSLYYKITDLRSVKRDQSKVQEPFPRKTKTCTTTTQTEPVVDKLEKKKVVPKKKKITNEKVAHISPQPRKDNVLLGSSFSLSPSVSITPIINSPTIPSLPFAPLSCTRPETPVIKTSSISSTLTSHLNAVTTTPTVTSSASLSSIAFVNGPPAFPGMKPKVSTSLGQNSSLSFSPSLSSSTSYASAVCTVQPLAINGCTIQPIGQGKKNGRETPKNNGHLELNIKDRDLLTPPPLSIAASPENISSEDNDKMDLHNHCPLKDTEKKDFVVKNGLSAKSDSKKFNSISRIESLTAKRVHTPSPSSMMNEPSAKISRHDSTSKSNGHQQQQQHIKPGKDDHVDFKSKISDNKSSLDEVRKQFVSKSQSQCSLVCLQKVLDLFTPTEQDKHKS